MARPAPTMAAARAASQESAVAADPPPAPPAAPSAAGGASSTVSPRGTVASVPTATGWPAEAARAPIARETPRAPSLTDELMALDSAKRLLDQGDSAGVLIALDRYARDFPAGRLQPEALALRAEALERHGDHALAMPLYERLVREYPDSPLCDRVRAIVGAPQR
jgi:TolA-binding protein